MRKSKTVGEFLSALPADKRAAALTRFENPQPGRAGQVGMTRKSVTAAAGLLLFCASGASSLTATSPDADLVGTYALKPNGNPSLRVTKQTSTFYSSNFDGKRWDTPVKAVIWTDKERADFAQQHKGLSVLAALHMNPAGSADQQADLLRVPPAPY